MIPIARPMISERVLEEIRDIIKSGILTNGPRVREFEKRFAAYIGVKHAVACNSGTAALHVALQALGVGPGDEVITTPYTFIATSNSALFLGAIPVFVDINSRTFNIDPDQIERAITEKTKAIVVVHLFGHPADMDPIMEISEKYGIPVVEDAAQAHGAKYKGRKVGSIGAMGAFSFYPTKNITTSEGGIVTTNDEKLAEKMREIINQGQSEKYNHVVLGYNYRMTEIAAAIGLEQLARLDFFNERRRKIASLYTKAVREKEWFTPPAEMEYAYHVYHLYALLAEEKIREDVINYLRKNDVDARGGYPFPTYKQQLYANINNPGVNPFAKIVKFPDYSTLSLPVAESVSRRMVHVPLYPALTDEEIEYIIKLLESYNPR